MNPLDNLKDIHSATHISNWPIAYGWWLVAVLILISIYATIRWVTYVNQRRKAKKQALKEVQQIIMTKNDSPAALNQILKRVAVVYFPGIAVQQLHGKEWAEFLINALPEKQSTKYSTQLTSLQNNLYQKQAVTETDIAEYQKTVEKWLKLALPPSRKTSQKLEQKHA
ncbi:DUF4381 domain-containing protein [Paraglaciecola aquimarina]|uniref:DUF4381 domain-containing protein n=1 Tax=Paraglaciecola aquimarina TaxID=1235557 RepID=A0ABU3SZS9_9ALTE|nr:DUF4381 domain-containing protein [Paraglaciecola aquimarina]MDU0355518.1 DUF4381 domain-containing protein [Paraglaciecola aquimarina]